jgi:hypothetical protein
VGPPLWTSGQSFWLQMQRSGFDSRLYQIFWKVLGQERGPFSLVSTIEELLERKNSVSGLGSREYGRRDPSRWQRGILYPRNLALTSSTSFCRSDSIVRSRSQATEFSFSLVYFSLVRKIQFLLSDSECILHLLHRPVPLLRKLHIFICKWQ